jgi:hypothetical protein
MSVGKKPEDLSGLCLKRVVLIADRRRSLALPIGDPGFHGKAAKKNGDGEQKGAIQHSQGYQT